MPKLIILGSSNAIPTAGAENTHMVVVGAEHMVLIDSVGNTILRLEQAGLDATRLTDIIITHFHPDHVSGLPLLLMDLWLMGREKEIRVHGLAHALDRIEGLMGYYNWSEWPGFFPVLFNRVPAEEFSTVIDCPEFKISASPVHHMIPTIGLRFKFITSNKVLAYSCDTEPCEEIVKLSAGADVLIHESAGESYGHSSAGQAGEIASRAEVGKLYLIHYATDKYNRGDLVHEAARSYQGEIALARDFMTLDFSEKYPLSRFGRGGTDQGKGGEESHLPSEP